MDKIAETIETLMHVQCGDPINGNGLDKAIDNAIELLEPLMWIPVIEQSPEKAEWVDVLYKDPQTKHTIATVGIYREYGDSLYPGDVLPKCWDVFDFYGERIAECPYVTHWRKRQPPKEGDGK